MVSEGGKICLDGRKSKTHPYSCLPKNVTEETKVLVMNKSVTIQGWFSKVHVFCFLVFRRASSRILRLTLSNVIFKDYGVYLYGVSCSNVIISNCSFINCDSAVVLKQLPSSKTIESVGSHPSKSQTLNFCIIIYPSMPSCLMIFSSEDLKMCFSRQYGIV